MAAQGEEGDLCMSTFVLSGGGTAGHINPALALAHYLKSEGHKVYFAGTPGGVEAELVPAAGIEFVPFSATGFDRSRPWTLLSGVSRIAMSTRKAARWFKEIKPDAVVGFGGYVSIPVARAAEQHDIPVILHEQNSVMGMANKYLAAKADAICLTYAVAGDAVEDKEKIHLTGNPVRASIFEATRAEGRRALGVPDDARMLLVFGGSLGARHINEAVGALKDELLERSDLYILHATGPRELDQVIERLDLSEDQAKRYRVVGYIDNMADALAAADVAISRAGATSLAEISARAVPAIFVPFPYATADHQTLNARAYVDSGAAWMIADEDIDDARFKDMVCELLDDDAAREKMTEAAKSLGAQQATENLAKVVLSCVK